MSRNLSLAAALVLHAIALGHRHGFDVIADTGLASGTVYPALRRLEATGHVVSQWEDAAVAQREQRPARRYYRITASGKAALATARERYGVLAQGAQGQLRRASR